MWLLCACGVRRIKDLLRVCPSFYLFCFLAPAFISFPAFFACPLFCLSSLACSCVLCGFCCCFFFPYGIYATRKGAKFCPLRPRFPCCGCLDSCIVIKEFLCRCFGFFQFVRFVLPTNTTGVRRLARFYFDFLRHNIDITNNRPAFLK